MQRLSQVFFHIANSKSSRTCDVKSTEEMAKELRDVIGRNSVVFTTTDKYIHIDLAGRAHYDKASQKYIPTPHVQVHLMHQSGDGKMRIAKKPHSTEPATKDDVRFARKLVGNQ